VTHPRSTPGATPIPAPCTTLALRIGPGEDLRGALGEAVRARGLGAVAVAACVGSLRRARLRLAGADTVFEDSGPFELVALSGTLGRGGEHLHAAVADSAGTVTGGHVLPGCEVHTTAELVLLCLGGLAFDREHDPATGYRELRIVPAPPDGNASPGP
jgi:predicted DNA-binding protein with PD1-like motif